MESEERAPPHRRPRRPSSAPAGPGAPATDPPAHNSGTDSVKVFVRIRPSGVAGLLAAGVPEEGGTPLQQVGEDALRVSGGGGPEAKVFALHGVLGPQCTQAEVYEDVGPLVLDSVRHGYNASVLAYGQTGSGKTHTMLGRTASTAGLAGGVGEDAGVIPRSFDELFRWLAGQAGQASVQCSVVEIYMEKITDLLHPGGNSLALLSDGGVKGLTWHTTKSAGDVLRLLDRATASRQTAATRMNAASSRSHMVLQCRVELRVALAADAANGNGVRPTRRGSVAVRVRRSLLSFVDLAGSERQKMAGTEGERLAEGAAINKSLLALSKVIYTLAAAPSVGSSTAPYVPYRDSVLTRLLQPSLGGNSRTVLLATVSPDRSCLAETLSTLEFAQRAKYVVNKVVAHDEVVEQRPDHGFLAPGSASAAHLAVTAAELAERDARIAALLRQLDRVAAEAAEQRQDAERRAEALAEQAAASTEAALEAARQQAQALAAASLERQATGVREATVAQLVEQEWELQEAQGELEAARRELEGARSEAEAARGQLYAMRDELEQAWQTQRMLAENLTQALASNAKLEASLQEERAALGKAMEALRGQAARPTIVSAPQGQMLMLSDESGRAELQHGTIERLQAADREAADELQARLADSETREREQAPRLQAHEQECAALRAQLANWEAQHQQAVRSWEADASSWQQEQAKLNVRVAAAEAREQEQVGALRAARRQLECLQAQLDRQTGELERERGGWLTLAGRLQTMVHGPANKQDVIPVDVHCTDGESHNGLEHITASRFNVWQERRNAQLQNLAAVRGWRAATGRTYGGHSLL